MKLKKIFFIIFVGIYTNIQAQGLKVTHMEGTYDLDGDGLKEFASIETSNLRSRDISVVRYYEIEQNGYQKMLWELQSPNGQIGNFVDVELGDLDGDGINELAVGASEDDDGGKDRGAVYILFLNEDGTVKKHQKIPNIMN